MSDKIQSSSKKAPQNSNDSLISIFLYIILHSKSSPNSPLSRHEIDDYLREYKIIIGKDDRKKTVRYINAFKDYFKGSLVETTKTIKDKNGKDVSVTAWYLASEYGPNFGGGNFSFGETSLLIDMLKDSKIKSSKCTNALIHKIAASIGQVKGEELLATKHEKGIYKNENNQLLETVEIAENAIKEFRQISISYFINGVEQELEVTPIKIDHIAGEYYLFAFQGNNYCSFLLKNINYIYALDDEAEVPDEYLIDSNEESEDDKDRKAIALDTLFSNTREITLAIKAGQYITFSYLSYEMLGKVVQLIESPSKKVIPVNSAYKDGKPYLIAIDPTNNYKPAFFRIDLMKDLKLGEKVDSMETKRFNVQEGHEYTDAHPFMLSGFVKMNVMFSIKESFLDRVIDAYGNKVKFIDKQKAFESLDGNLLKLARTFRQLDFTDAVGFDHNENLVRFIVETTDEEAFRFALQNADVAELLTPTYLRERVLSVSKKVEARYSKTQSDHIQETYLKVISGKDFLIFDSFRETDKHVRQQIEKKNTFDKVKKLKIQRVKQPLSLQELEKFTNVEELVIDGNGVADFSWIKKLSSLRQLTLIDTSITNANVLAGISQLDLLFLNRNRSLENYEFLKSMKVGSLFMGRNGKADTSALYDVKYVNNLVIEENLLFDLDVERLENIRIEVDGRQRHMMVSRWIDDIYSSSEMPKVYRLPLKR